LSNGCVIEMNSTNSFWTGQNTNDHKEYKRGNSKTAGCLSGYDADQK
jgi:hypothetical protein